MKTLGSDPELLIVKGTKPQSAIGVVQGTAENRIYIKGHAFYYDNVLAECAIKPGRSKKDVVGNFREALEIYAKMVRPFKLKPQACCDFPDSQLRHEDARKVGCAPDWCAYEVKLKEPPKEAIQNGNLRSCGGHIHLGSDLLASDGPEPILAIYLLDLFVGVPSLWLDKDPTSARRRAIYGHAGRYRSKDYGLEYRSLSNFWLTSPDLVGLIYDLCKFTHDYLEDGRGWDLWKFDEEVFYDTTELSEAWTCSYDTAMLRKAINFGDQKLAEPLLKLAMDQMPKTLRTNVQAMMDRAEDGDFYANWGLT